MTAPSPERATAPSTRGASTRVDLAIRGIRLLDAPVSRRSGAGPSETIQYAVAAPPEREITMSTAIMRRVAMDRLRREQASAVAVISPP